mmetsp:Transcript_14099/g.32880  ORF Transcript_14099/g.32880 Transcript_14099/m.32880 type:complete len:232 (-) Transcript_14099:1077-1772(-)
MNSPLENISRRPQFRIQVPARVSELWDRGQPLPADNATSVFGDILVGGRRKVRGVDRGGKVSHELKRSQNRVLQAALVERKELDALVEGIVLCRIVHNLVNLWKVVRRAGTDVEVAPVDDVGVAQSEDASESEGLALQHQSVMTGQAVRVRSFRHQVDCQEHAVVPSVRLVDQRRDVGDLAQVAQRQGHAHNAEQREQGVDSPVHGRPQVQRRALVESRPQRSEFFRKPLV